MTCSYCGTDLPQGAMFCGECGRSVIPRPAPTAPRPSAPVPVDAAGSVRDAPLPPPEPVSTPAPAEPAPPRPRDTAGYDPFPWGKPPAEIPVVPPVYDPPPMLDRAVVPDADPPFGADLDDETQIVDRSLRGERFILQFSTGESVSVGGTGLLGRNPVAEPGEYFDTIVTISDPGKSVSKTHLEFGQEGGAFWVSDRFSGNGTMVREPERPSRRCEPGKRYRIVRGTRVQIGEQFFIVS